MTLSDHRRSTALLAMVAALVVVAGVRALGTGQSFNAFLETGYKQEIYATADLGTDPDDPAIARTVLGGVAFAPDGDVWSAECVFGFDGTRLHRFDSQTNRPTINNTPTLHPELPTIATSGGCGLVNHPDGAHMYSNSAVGVVQLDVSTGAVTATFPETASHPGNALGIAVDPLPGHHVLYAGAACHPTLPFLLGLPFETPCTIYDLDPSTGSVTSFATVESTFIDGIYFDPTGTFLFVAQRGDGVSTFNALVVLRRPENSAPNTAEPQLVQQVLLANEPDGVAFHAASPRFVLTNDEEGGTMTQVTFPGDDYTAVPMTTTFAAGGFRGDLLQVGADGCVYATQGRDFLASDFGARYDDGTVTSEDSLVRICADNGGGFVPPTGVPETVQPPNPDQPCSGIIGDFVWVDLNRNGLQDAGEPGLGGVALSLTDVGGNTLATATTAPSGSYQFSGLCAGAYHVGASTPAGYDQTKVQDGSNPAVDSNSNPASVVLTTDASSELTIDFGLVNGFCEKQPVQTELNPNGSHFPGNRGPDVIVRTQQGMSIQYATDHATDVNSDGYIIVGVVAVDGGLLGGHVSQHVVVSRAYSAPFALIGCSVTLHASNPGVPTARVLASASAPADGIGARIFVMDVHAEDSANEGWLVEGDNRYLRNVYGKHNAIGVRFVGNANVMHNGSVEGNTGPGLAIEGSGNLATDTNAYANGGDGVWIAGNGNQVLKVDAGDKNKGNGGDGVHVQGAGNLVSEVDAYANRGDGVEIVATTGAPNVVKKTVAGGKGGKGNVANGILVSGSGNGAASPIELEQNTTMANGQVGIRITGTGHQLKNNLSGGTGSGETNIGCEFQAASGNVNATGNKANGVAVPGANGSGFPTVCIGG